MPQRWNAENPLRLDPRVPAAPPEGGEFALVPARPARRCRPGWYQAAMDGAARLLYISIETQEARMAERSSMLHVRMDNELKRRATEALAAMGLTASQAVRLLFHRIAVEQAFPLELKVPNAETRAAMAEADEIVKAGRARFATVEEMLADLEETGRP